MSEQPQSPWSPSASDGRQPLQHVEPSDPGSPGSPPITSADGQWVWNGHEWVPAPHLSPDGKAWWNGASWVAVPSPRHRLWGIIAIVLAVLTLGYCAPMSVIGIADSRAQPDYSPGLFEALYPLLLAIPAVVLAVTSIVLDRREHRRPLLGWVSITLAGLSALFLWFFIFAGT